MLPGRFLTAGLLFFIGCLSFPAAAISAEIADVPVISKRIAVFDPTRPGQLRVGKLEFVGGLVLRSPYPHFGAFSGLRIRDDQLTAITDTAYWFQGKIDRDDSGVPIGISGGRMAPMLGPSGRAFKNRWYTDAEGLTLSGKSVFVSTEQSARILKFSGEGDLLKSRADILNSRLPGPRLSYSFGMEALATLPKEHALAGTLLAITEGSLYAQKDARAFLVGSDKTAELSVKVRDRFYITDADIPKYGELFLLERRFPIGTGPQVRIRRIDVDTIKPGAVLDGEIIFEAGRNQQIDNMEGLSVFIGPDGFYRIGLISDNNHWMLQRTLYLEFKLR